MFVVDAIEAVCQVDVVGMAVRNNVNSSTVKGPRRIWKETIVGLPEFLCIIKTNCHTVISTGSTCNCYSIDSTWFSSIDIQDRI